MMTRRTFVSALTAAAAVGGFGLGGALLQRRRLAAGRIGAADVRPLQGADMTLRSPAGRTWRAAVTDVTAVRRPARHGAPATEQISLLVAVHGATPDSGRYRLEGIDLSLDELYFTAVGPAGSDRRLEAVITRIV